MDRPMSLQKNFFESVSYWEPKRIFYNLVLFVLAAVCWGPDIVAGRIEDWILAPIILLAFAIVANLLYCLAYPVDVILKFTPAKNHWLQTRWVLFALGVAAASAIAIWVLIGDGMA